MPVLPSETEVYRFLGELAEAHCQAEPMAMTGPYKGGEINRLNKTWLPDNFSGDSAVGEGWELLTRRIRDLQRNDPSIIALRRALVDHIVGTGIVTTANVMIAGELEEEFNSQSDDEFEWWAENEADLEGRLALQEIERQAFSEMLDSGEALMLRCQSDDPSRTVPLCYQALEAEQIDASQDWPAGADRLRCVRGIELDGANRPVAYWLFDAHPSDPHVLTSTSRRVPADRVLHMISPGRPSQTRGISLYSSITQSAWDLDNYLGAELTAANIGALFTMVHKTKHPTAAFGFVGDGSDSSTTDDYGNPKARLGRGIVCQVGAEDTVEQIEPKRPSKDARVFVDLLMMLVAMGGNVSPYRLTRDYRGTTYVAGRCARMDDTAAFQPLQGFVGRQFSVPIRRQWTAQAVAYGVLNTVSARIYRMARRRWDRLLIQPPGVPQIDPEKETDSDIAGINAGFETLESVCARRGTNWRKVILQRKREIEFERKHLGSLGAAFSYDRPSTPARPRASDEPAGNGRAD